MAPGISENLHTPVIYIYIYKRTHLFIQFNLFICLCSRLKFINDFWGYVVWCQAHPQELDRRAGIRS